MKNNKEIIGFVGLGFVGNSARECFRQHYHTEVFDINEAKATVKSLNELVEKADVIFMALPTPIDIGTGKCKLDIIEESLGAINQISKEKIVVLKSSVPPGSSQYLQSKYKNINLVFNPEFLTERNAVKDFQEQNWAILAGKKNDVKFVKKIFTKCIPNIYVYTTDYTTAEMVKFTINTSLAVKVSFLNEISQICDALSVDYDKMMELALLDNRIGHSHTSVPGWDGKKGFGGSCFPANISILISRCKELGVNPTVLSAAWNKNLEVRPERDWEELKGRVVI